MSESSDTVMQLRALHLSDVLQDATPKQKLQRLLSTISTASAISTTSSFAQRQQDNSEQPENQSYRSVGAGSCGVIYECTGTTFAFKVARNDNLQLWNDFQMHSLVMAMFDKHKQLTADICVPRCKTFILPDDKDWWAANISNFPEDVQASMVLWAERILPLPKIVRELLLTEYCPAHLLERARTDPMNSDCLVRLYLGRRRRTETTSRPQRFFTLRNLPLYLDQILDLQLEVDEFASNMAKALAVMHWEAKIDADDVEFVLGRSPTFSAPVRELDLAVILAMKQPTSTLNMTNSAPNFCRRKVHMWLLDFNLCGSISMDEQGVDKAVKAFYKNDPYFPRPLAEASRDQQLWKTFRDQYLRASDKLLGAGPARELPNQFIKKVIAEQQARVSRKVESTSSEIVLRSGAYWVAMGFTLVIIYGLDYSRAVDSGDNTEQDIGLISLGTLAIIFPFLLALRLPESVRQLYGGKVMQSATSLIGFYGVMPDPHWVANSGRLASVDNRPPLLKGHGFFTLVDTGSLTVSIFSAVRPPSVALICGRKGGMLRTVLYYYERSNNCLYKETVMP